MDKRLISALIIMISVFGFFAFVLPNFSRIKLLRQAIEERKVVLAEKKALMDKISGLVKEIDSGGPNIEKLAMLIPAKKSVPELVSTIEAAASRAGLAVAEIRFSEDLISGRTEDYNKISSEVKLVGFYGGAFNFLEQLEQNLRIIDVNSVAISELPGSTNLNISVKFDSYYLSSNK